MLPSLCSTAPTVPRTPSRASPSPSASEPVALASERAAPAGDPAAPKPARDGLLRASAAALRGGWRGGFVLALVCGALDAIANVIVLVGLRVGDLTIVSVLTALYPRGHDLAGGARAARAHRKRCSGWGLALALAASAMLAAA